ncbi:MULTISPECIES: IclR family transcriptional regulator [unclassified Haladaptatus]|uniref:IclR family transcriptional regulator n=1 Tax=unclassified Haladaptatus TaxID=2622732 RepID=UPI00209C47B2|nr:MULTISPECIES: IclR family transcriptional regulator [unclassified Haladaptatus]MCO8243577.1 IclR family transcriptional regulator [Haladaptatus sp. AB643]MCO8254986.1 IclR family transcriptional regulator [Haladaptatus sp. AB618]
MGKYTSRVRTTETSLDVLDVLFEREAATVEELETELDLTNSTVHRHLSTLQERGYVVRDEGSYRLSFKLLTMGGRLRRNVTAYPVIKTKVDDLAAETNERVQFIVREQDERIYLYTQTGDSLVQTGAYTGRRGPIYSSAAGKAIIANLPNPERDRLIDSLDLRRTGPNTITDRDALREDLRTIRERGYSLNLEESTGGVHAVGAAVRGKDDGIVGALSVSGPATRLKDERLERELPDAVLAATNELELHIAHT